MRLVYRPKAVLILIKTTYRRSIGKKEDWISHYRAPGELPSRCDGVDTCSKGTRDWRWQLDNWETYHCINMAIWETVGRNVSLSLFGVRTKIPVTLLFHVNSVSESYQWWKGPHSCFFFSFLSYQTPKNSWKINLKTRKNDAKLWRSPQKICRDNGYCRDVGSVFYQKSLLNELQLNGFAKIRVNSQGKFKETAPGVQLIFESESFLCLVTEDVSIPSHQELGKTSKYFHPKLNYSVFDTKTP